MDVLITDVKGFMWLFLIPVFVAVVRSRNRLRTLLSWVLAGALIQAALILAVNAAVVLSDNPEPLCRWLTAHSIGLVDIVSNKLVRVFFKSSPYMIVGCVVVLFRQARAPKLRWRYVLAVALLFNALLLSYTRSLYGALGLTAVLSITAVLILCPAGRKRVLAFLLAAVVCFGVLVTVQEFVLEGSYLSFAVSRTIGQEVPTSWASQLRGRIRGDISDDKPNDAEMDRQRSYIEVTEKSDQFRQEPRTASRTASAAVPSSAAAWALRPPAGTAAWTSISIWTCWPGRVSWVWCCTFCPLAMWCCGACGGVRCCGSARRGRPWSAACAPSGSSPGSTPG